MDRVVAEYDQRAAISQSCIWQIVGLVVLVCHVVLVKALVYLYPVAILLILWLYASSALAGVLVFIQILLYQNLIISIFSSGMDYTTFSALQGTNFVTIAAMAGIALVRILPTLLKRKLLAAILGIAFTLLILYTLYGAAKAGPTSALIYFRYFSIAIFGALVGLDVGRLWGIRTIGVCLFYGGILSLVIDAIEYFYPIEYYECINAVQFSQLKYLYAPENVFYTPEDVVHQWTSSFFNLTGTRPGEMAFDSFRFQGPIMNPISNGYILAILALLALALRKDWWLIILLPMMVMIGAKGGAVLLISSFIIYCVWVAGKSRRLLVCAGLGLSAVYLTSVIYLGLQNNDWHVLGFLGGLRSFIHNPLGHGIGVGGNLSTNARAGFKWAGHGGFQQGGVDFAVESAVGVIFYQMGLASLPVLGVFAALIWDAPLGSTAGPASEPRRTDILFVAVAMVALNGVFQEEAFAPYASGLVMLLASALAGNRRAVGRVVPRSGGLDCTTGVQTRDGHEPGVVKSLRSAAGV